MEKIAALKWWHRIPIGLDASGQTVYTPGEVEHGINGADYATTRFGIPLDLTGKKVLDIGGYNGYFAFEAERRGAEYVCMVDYFQGPGFEAKACFELAKELLGSSVDFVFDYFGMDSGETLAINGCPTQYDVVMQYGVLYHSENPLDLLKGTFEITAPGGIVLIETAILETIHGMPLLAFRPGYHNDPTNIFYPNIDALKAMLLWVGFDTFEIVHDMGPRVTVRVTKPMHVEAAA